jgi:radical SAM protein with 4Fe4S-binding SPASM domain
MSYTKSNMAGFSDPRTLFQIDRLYAWKHGEFFPPATIEISPINVCNQKCRYCYIHGRSQNIKKDKGLSTEMFVSIIRQCGEIGVSAVILQGTGEPLLHPGVPAAFAEAQRRNLYMSITTNGVLLDKDLAEDILPKAFAVRLSNVIPEKEPYTYIHDCPESHFDKLMQNIQDAVKIRRDKNLKTGIWGTLYLDENNFEKIVLYVKTLKELGMDYLALSEAKWTSDTFIKESLPLSDETLKDKKAHLEEIIKQCYDFCDDDFKIKTRFSIDNMLYPNFRTPEEYIPNSCGGAKFFNSIDSDGNVYPCWRFWGNTDFSYGNLNNAGLNAILRSQKADDVFKYLNTVPPKSDECFVCGHGVLNEALNKLKNVTPWHNFMN